MNISPKLLILRFKKLWAIFTNLCFFKNFINYKIAPSIELYPLLNQCQPITIIDVGANKGQFSSLAKYCYPSAKIYAFEPNPNESKNIDKILSTTDEFLPFGLGEERGIKKLFIPKEADSASLLQPTTQKLIQLRQDVNKLEELAIKLTTAKDFFRDKSFERPALLKIDVQGTELDVIRGFGAQIENIDYIICECSFANLYHGQSTTSEIVQTLLADGFYLAALANPETNAGNIEQVDMLFKRLPK